MKFIVGISLLISVFTSSFAGNSDKKNNEGTIIIIETTYGKIKIKLYEETPLHRDNFLKLARERYFDSLLFHRVIKGFMIQGGDPDSRNATRGQSLGMGSPGYTIKAEIKNNFIHKKGALAAARTGDQMNPLKESSGSQFYIVQGTTISDEMLDATERHFYEKRKGEVLNAFLMKPENAPILANIRDLRDKQRTEEFNMRIDSIVNTLSSVIGSVSDVKYTPLQREQYKKMGGTPHLDREYTIFGEVFEGLDIVDKIASVATDGQSRPLEDIRIKVVIAKK